MKGSRWRGRLTWLFRPCFCRWLLLSAPISLTPFPEERESSERRESSEWKKNDVAIETYASVGWHSPGVKLSARRTKVLGSDSGPALLEFHRQAGTSHLRTSKTQNKGPLSMQTTRRPDDVISQFEDPTHHHLCRANKKQWVGGGVVHEHWTETGSSLSRPTWWLGSWWLQGTVCPWVSFLHGCGWFGSSSCGSCGLQGFRSWTLLQDVLQSPHNSVLHRTSCEQCSHFKHFNTGKWLSRAVP